MKNQITEKDYDILLDTEIEVDIMLGASYLNVGGFLELQEGDVVSLDKAAGEGADIFVNTRIVGEGDIMVIEEKLAVKVQDVMDSDKVIRFFFDEKII